jgi:hypothetical protein
VESDENDQVGETCTDKAKEGGRKEKRTKQKKL